MNCWSCGAKLSDPAFGKVAFRAACDNCGSALHCCLNCVYYKPGLPNNCAVPGTEFIADRAASNLCEEFRLLGKKVSKPSDPKEAAKKLFGEEGQEEGEKGDPKKRFNALFDD